MSDFISIQEAAELLKGWDNILVLSHASPDGDTLGSASVLMRGLISLGKSVDFKCADEIADKFSYLFDGIKIKDLKPDKIVSVDVADKRLLGKYKEDYGDKIDLAIDHHAGHVPFGCKIFVDAGCAANTEIMYKLMKELGVEIDQQMADAVYTGLSTDTGCFRYMNVTAQTHKIAAEVIELGARNAEINRVMFETVTKAQMEAEMLALSSLEYYLDGRCAVLSITRDMMEQTGITDDDLDALTARPRQIEGVLAGITIKQKEDGSFKISARTNEPANSCLICQKLGGGGHKGAAGCSFRGTLEEAKNSILRACEEHFKEIEL